MLCSSAAVWYSRRRGVQHCALQKVKTADSQGVAVHWGFQHPEHMANLWCCVYAVTYVGCVRVADRIAHTIWGSGHKDCSRRCLLVTPACSGVLSCIPQGHCAVTSDTPALRQRAASLQHHPCVLTGGWHQLAGTLVVLPVGTANGATVRVVGMGRAAHSFPSMCPLPHHLTIARQTESLSMLAART